MDEILSYLHENNEVTFEMYLEGNSAPERTTASAIYLSQVVLVLKYRLSLVHG
jgi:hypothetical protein